MVGICEPISGGYIREPESSDVLIWPLGAIEFSQAFFVKLDSKVHRRHPNAKTITICDKGYGYHHGTIILINSSKSPTKRPFRYVSTILASLNKTSQEVIEIAGTPIVEEERTNIQQIYDFLECKPDTQGREFLVKDLFFIVRAEEKYRIWKISGKINEYSIFHINRAPKSTSVVLVGCGEPIDEIPPFNVLDQADIGMQFRYDWEFKRCYYELEDDDATKEELFDKLVKYYKEKIVGSFVHLCELNEGRPSVCVDDIHEWIPIHESIHARALTKAYESEGFDPFVFARRPDSLHYYLITMRNQNKPKLF